MMFKKSETGFTLIELLVTTGIVIFFTSLAFANYRAGQRQVTLKRATNQLAQDIRRAQEMTTAAKECCGIGVPPGYGIRLDRDANTYILYADTAPAQGNEFYSSADEEIETITLEGVYVKEIYIDPVGRSSSSINFKPPDPIIKIKHLQGDDYREVVITLALDVDPNLTSTITINKGGLIDAD